jgi:hypothetical protein
MTPNEDTDDAVASRSPRDPDAVLATAIVDKVGTRP